MPGAKTRKRCRRYRALRRHVYRWSTAPVRATEDGELRVTEDGEPRSLEVRQS
jgi:hypothetical protein